MTTQQAIALTRALVGLAQGFALYLIFRAAEIGWWPATEPLAYSAALAVAVLIPLIIAVGLHNMRPRTLAVWALLAAACSAGLGFYDIFREPLLESAQGSRLEPTPILWMGLGSVLFIAHSLATAADADRKLVAGYARYFDVSWKIGVQLALAVSFVAAFWALLFLSAELFQMIGIRTLGELIQRRWFYVPATTVALACAIHVTDARADLVRGVRMLALTLLAWLLPLMTAFAVAFLLALPVTGLEPLWRTRYATGTLLAAVAALVLLINAAYQDGQDAAPPVVRYARSVAALVLVPLVSLAAYGLTLRAQQYGWTPQRIIAGACVAVAICYAVGYAAAALRSNLALRGLETTNVATAYVVVVIVLCLLSPVADPARIAVADQLRRLESGQESPLTFDFKFLKFGSGRYGRAALEKLAAQTDGPQAAIISERAKLAMALINRWSLEYRTTASQRAENIAVVHPRGQALPDGFLRQDWTGHKAGQWQWQLPRCLITLGARCQAVLLDLDGDGSTEIILFDVSRVGGSRAGAFKAASDESWTWLGPIPNAHCSTVLDGLDAGQLQVAEPRLKDIEINGIRLRVASERGCPAQGARR